MSSQFWDDQPAIDVVDDLDIFLAIDVTDGISKKVLGSDLKTYMQTNDTMSLGPGDPNTTDGFVLLTFNTDRPWVFEQDGNSSTAELALRPTVNTKIFRIISEDKSNTIADFLVENSFTGSKIALLQNGGNLGIGTSNPFTTLEVNGSQTIKITTISANYITNSTTNDYLIGIDNWSEEVEDIVVTLDSTGTGDITNPGRLIKVSDFSEQSSATRRIVVQTNSGSIKGPNIITSPNGFLEFVSDGLLWYSI